MTGRADASRDVQLLSYHIVPKLVDSLLIRLFILQRRHIRHGRIHISSPDCMADSLILFRHRFMVLPVSSVAELVFAVVVVFILTAGIQKEFG